MIGPGSDAKILIYTKPIDFRCGIDALVTKVQHELQQDPWGGVAYVFRSRRKDRLKILWFDGSGMWLMTKRAEGSEGVRLAAAGRRHIPDNRSPDGVAGIGHGLASAACAATDNPA